MARAQLALEKSNFWYNSCANALIPCLRFRVVHSKYSIPLFLNDHKSSKYRVLGSYLLKFQCHTSFVWWNLALTFAIKSWVLAFNRPAYIGGMFCMFCIACYKYSYIILVSKEHLCSKKHFDPFWNQCESRFSLLNIYALINLLQSC